MQRGVEHPCRPDREGDERGPAVDVIPRRWAAVLTRGLLWSLAVTLAPSAPGMATPIDDLRGCITRHVSDDEARSFARFVVTENLASEPLYADLVDARARDDAAREVAIVAGRVLGEQCVAELRSAVTKFGTTAPQAIASMLFDQRGRVKPTTGNTFRNGEAARRLYEFLPERGRSVVATELGLPSASPASGVQTGNPWTTPLKIDVVPLATCPYPDESRRAGETGSITATVFVDADGKASDAGIVQSSGYARLDAAVLECLAKVPLKPTLQDGKPVGSYQQVRWTFVLER